MDAEERPRIAARTFGWEEDGSDAKQGLRFLACDSASTDVARCYRNGRPVAACDRRVQARWLCRDRGRPEAGATHDVHGIWREARLAP